MIYFFRRIRKKLADNNQFLKYSRYAIGEIVLVMAGILLALQVNNWNEERKEIQLEARLLNEILTNLESDKISLEQKKKDVDFFILHNSLVAAHLDNDLPLSDSLRYSYAMLYGFGWFHPNTIGYDNLKSIGIDIISNKQLSNKISELYTVIYYRFTDEIERTVNRFQGLLLEEINTSIKQIVTIELAEPVDLDKIRRNHEFKNAVMFNIRVLKMASTRYESGIKQIEVVAQSIREELNN